MVIVLSLSVEPPRYDLHQERDGEVVTSTIIHEFIRIRTQYVRGRPCSSELCTCVYALEFHQVSIPHSTHSMLLASELSKDLGQGVVLN